MPIDAVPLGRKLGDFSSVIDGRGQRPSEIQQQIHSLIDPGPTAPRRRHPADEDAGERAV